MKKTPSSANGKRARTDTGANEAGNTTKRSSISAKTESVTSKASKGLRHFSMKVCKKVEEKRRTTYNEVADELVREFMAQRTAEAALNPPTSATKGKKTKGSQNSYDEKNIRRRVYDALNVLMAMEIISKEKKEIRWKGLPANHDLEMLQREKEHRMKEVERKRECLQELLVQQVCFRNLVKRNREREMRQNAVSHQEIGHATNSDNKEKIPMPFIIVNTSSNAVVHCEMNTEKTEVNFDFSMPFEINDDNEILKRLGLNNTTYEEVRRMLPSDLISYCQEHNLLDNIITNNEAHGTHYDPVLPPNQHLQHSQYSNASSPGYVMSHQSPMPQSFHPHANNGNISQF